jgi:hypothetical protein
VRRLAAIACVTDLKVPFAAVEDLSIDFLVVFENGKPKFYYSDVDDLNVDVTVLLHFEEGSRLSDHDIARLLAGQCTRSSSRFLRESDVSFSHPQICIDTVRNSKLPMACRTSSQNSLSTAKPARGITCAPAPTRKKQISVTQFFPACLTSA